MKALCVLKSGGPYGPEHVQRLARQVPGIGLWCLSDVEVPGVPTLPLRHQWPRWWSKIEAFRPDLPGDLLYLDLDSEIVGNLDQLLEIGRASEDSLLWNDPIRPQYANSSVMWIRQADKPIVFDAFQAQAKRHMADYKRWPDKWGDQGFIAHTLPRHGRWPNGLIRSWRLECRAGIPEGAVVLAFHGKPKPWDVEIERRVIPAGDKA